jgi:hypothetical protein
MRETATQLRDQHTLDALGCLGAARNLRITRASWLREAFATYGDQGSLISGIEREHFPEELKDRLRTNARAIATAVDDAFVCWRKAGRRTATLRRELDKYRVDGSRY